MIRVKQNVEFSHISFLYHDLTRIINMVQMMAPDGYGITITSGCDGKHKVNSAHYRGKAFDFRTRDFPEGKSLAVWRDRIQAALGSQYFVLLESTHLHVQYNG